MEPLARKIDSSSPAISNFSSSAPVRAVSPSSHRSQPNERGCQLSILVHEHPKELFQKLEAAGVKCDFREPNVIRAAPTPLYNTFHEVWRFAEILANISSSFSI